MNRRDYSGIREIVRHYHYPFGDFKGVNKLLKESGYHGIKKKTLTRLLEY